MKSHPSTGRRERVLQAVRAAEGAVGADELAADLSVHPNTVRFHLAALERSGDVERRDAQSMGRGRPRALYRPSAGAHEGERHYEMLAGVLATGLGHTEQGRTRATEAGYAWGLTHARSAAPRERDAVGELFRLLGELGFAPRRADAGTVELLNCPFRQTVAEHGELICAVHAGLMRGALAGWGAEAEVTSLEPFATPGLCRARLSEGAGA
ncbi:helix-turn-helix transcriptional regulator [Rothia halotolerans]|uniref:helix-turn-helix transcriptional regulator n=1 Tax=Rothia halotolerans TaxID=405770 RepID=UPI00101C9816|nr:HTH domain-containing protein [Rothia halotolerans]